MKVWGQGAGGGGRQCTVCACLPPCQNAKKAFKAACPLPDHHQIIDFHRHIHYQYIISHNVTHIYFNNYSHRERIHTGIYIIHNQGIILFSSHTHHALSYISLHYTSSSSLLHHSIIDISRHACIVITVIPSPHCHYHNNTTTNNTYT